MLACASMGAPAKENRKQGYERSKAMKGEADPSPFGFPWASARLYPHPRPDVPASRGPAQDVDLALGVEVGQKGEG